MANTNKHYYELNITSRGEWSDREDFTFTGHTYDSVMTKAKAHNIDVTDVNTWFTRLYYQKGDGFVVWCYLYMVDGTPKWEWKVDLDSDPIPFKLAQKAEAEKVE